MVPATSPASASLPITVLQPWRFLRAPWVSLRMGTLLVCVPSAPTSAVLYTVTSMVGSSSSEVGSFIYKFLASYLLWHPAEQS